MRGRISSQEAGSLLVGAIIGLFYEVIKKSVEYLLIYKIICIFATEKNKRE